MTFERAPRTTAPTLEEVAAAAGVSRSTVSRVVNGSPKVTSDVVTSVRQAIESLGYVPNRAARSLAQRRSMAIALVVPEDTSRFFADPYFASIVSGITSVLDDSEYVLVLQLAKSKGSAQNTIRYLLGGNVDGALVVSHHSTDVGLAQLAAALPVVFNGRLMQAIDAPTYFVDVDNVAGGMLGTQKLIDIGRRRIAILAGPDDMRAGIDRVVGWQRALEGAGLSTERLGHGDFTRAGGAASMRDVLERFPDVDGVFAASDLMASGAVAVLRESGRSVPGDVAIVGFDDAPSAIDGDVRLTTVHQPAEVTGATMAHMLLARLRGEDIERERILPTHLVERDSA